MHKIFPFLLVHKNICFKFINFEFPEISTRLDDKTLPILAHTN